MSKLANFNNNYSFCGLSAMSDSISSGVLSGRPYGGTGIMIKNDLDKYVTFRKYGDRFCIVAIQKTVFISVYLPSSSTPNDEAIVADTISKVENELSAFSNYTIVCGGDLNVNLSSNKSTANLLRSVIKRLRLGSVLQKTCQVK